MLKFPGLEWTGCKQYVHLSLKTCIVKLIFHSENVSSEDATCLVVILCLSGFELHCVFDEF